MTHSFCSFPHFGTLGGVAGMARSTLDRGHSPVPLNSSKLVCCIDGRSDQIQQTRVEILSGENKDIVYSDLPSSSLCSQWKTLWPVTEQPLPVLEHSEYLPTLANTPKNRVNRKSC